MRNSYDCIVVGAGTAGCLLANRLSERRDRSVLLVEAGPRPPSFWVDMPAGMSRLIFPGSLNWGFQTEKEPHLQGRPIYAPRGRGVGGSSLINGMAFFRGQAQDYDDWQEYGVQGWGWRDVLPLFRKIENRPGATSERRGTSGELHISDASFVHPATRDFIASAVASGAPFNPDFNDASAEGVGNIQYNICHGMRHNAGRLFSSPSRSRVPTGARQGSCRLVYAASG